MNKNILLSVGKTLRLLIFAIGGLALGLAACSPPENSLAPTRGYILISIDTLRADHLGCYGYGHDTSPFIDSLAARGVLFENAFVQLPGTLPSHMSIFTGLYPTEHGVFPPAGVLSPDIETLPEAFQRAGFRTAGHTEGGYVHGSYGFERGFDEFSHEARKKETDIEQTLERGLKFLRGLEREDRFFLFLHSYVVHDPYFPPEKYLQRFWQQSKPEVFPATGPNLVAVNRGTKHLSTESLAFFQASYDASINYMDDVLKGFFGELSKTGILDDSVIILTSDHGEEFREHGKLVHEQIYQETLRVPLIVLHPALSEARRVSTVVQSIDIAPTLYDITGAKPANRVSGRSLVPLLTGVTQNESEAFAVSFGLRHRTLIEQRDESLRQLVLKMPVGNVGKPVWVSDRSRSFDAFTSELEFEVRSFHAPDQLLVEVDGELPTSFDIHPDTWSSVKVRLGEGAAKKRVHLSSANCTVPKDVGEGEDERCLSFLVRGAPMFQLELYNLANDPRGLQDVSAHEGEFLRGMAARLGSYDLTPVADTKADDLDPELKERLEALGYLQ